MEPELSRDEVYAAAREAVEKLVAEEGPESQFPFDYIWQFASREIPSLRRPSCSNYLVKLGYLEKTGKQVNASTPERAGNLGPEYRPGRHFLPPAPPVPPPAPGGVEPLAPAFEEMEKALATQGLLIDKADLANFYLALCVSPLVVLSGISGTGKSQMPRRFAQLTDSRFDSVPVKPQWSDNSDLFGYVPSLNPTHFVKGRFTEVVEAAQATPGQLAVVLLDEMNLAAVEHYFSDFLSIMETRRREAGTIITDPLPLELPTAVAGQPDPYAGLRTLGLPANVRVVGTANMDETTHLFSPKVLDRAFSIESVTPDLTQFPSGEAQPFDATTFARLVPRLLDVSNVVSESEAYVTDAELLNEIGALLQEASDVLRPAGISFGYRTRRDVCLYMHFWRRFDLANILSASAAMDLCFLQKILPKVQGAGEGLGEALRKLREWLLTEDGDTSVASSRPWTRSADKVERMLARLEAEGATTYWGT
ncbi:McrB family protein [Hymenobacter psychrotolerans]|uniref:AAA domain (Dynein-related subfamily) n=1 Tax=Hymenobacter psychrotolerans DSM 18569 TaxID=1121959 RepID=A0A1M7EF34_9BACT|nr:AAA family ATPase [Hymenobacter psychrotolerans]SHL90401.1 AAA domain (dynein-related subfamily) [Hymenobacter psychrotolerans DSM 18569]